MDQSYLAVDIFFEKMEIQRFKYIHKIHIFPLLFFHFRFRVTTLPFHNNMLTFFLMHFFDEGFILDFVLNPKKPNGWINQVPINCLFTYRVFYDHYKKLPMTGLKGRNVSSWRIEGTSPSLETRVEGDTPWKNWGLLVSVFDF